MNCIQNGVYSSIICNAASCDRFSLKLLGSLFFCSSVYVQVSLNSQFGIT